MKGFIAVDGGGSKTEIVLCDEFGNVLKHEIVNCSNPNDVSMEVSVLTLSKAIKPLFKVAKKNKLIIDNISLLIAGIEFGNSKAILKEELVKKLKFNNLYVDGDLASVKECGLSSKENGIVIISGTGFNMSIKHNHTFIPIGGWGYMADDYLSGFDLGKDALIACSRAINKVNEDTILVEMLENHFNSSLWYAMKQIYESGIKGVASLSRFVMEAYNKKDKVAREIVDNRITKLVNVIKEKNPIKNEKTDVVLFGGIFENNNVIVNKLSKLLGENYHISVSKKKTIYGAVSIARKMINEEIHKGFYNNFDKSYKDLCKLK